jgi:hypothetical protein
MPPLGTPAPSKPKCYGNASLSAIGRRRWSRLKNRPRGEGARAGADRLRSAFEPQAESYPTGRRLRDARRGLAQRSHVRPVGERVGGVVSLRLARKATGEGATAYVDATGGVGGLSAITDLGPTQLKNIAEPIRVYSLEVGKPMQAKPPGPRKRSALAQLAAGGVRHG